MTRKLIEEYGYWKLNVNIDKTKYLCVGDENTNIELENHEKIESYKKYRCLGMEFNTQGTDQEELKAKNT